jgi:hypothetical protein
MNFMKGTMRKAEALLKCLETKGLQLSKDLASHSPFWLAGHQVIHDDNFSILRGSVLRMLLAFFHKQVYKLTYSIIFFNKDAHS